MRKRGGGPSGSPRPSKHSAADRRAAGRVPLQVWITPEQKRRLTWIRDEDGHDFAQIVGGHIDEEYEERRPKK